MGAGSHALATVRKTLTLTLLFTVVIYLLAAYADSLTQGGSPVAAAATGAQSPSAQANGRLFRAVGQANLAYVGVALGNGIATSGKVRATVPVDLADDALSASDLLGRKNLADQDFIGQNMKAIQEYANVLSVNVKGLLASSPDRAAVLDSYLDQLKYRYTATVEAQSALAVRSAGAQQELAVLQKDMDTLKAQIAAAYDRYDAEGTQARLQDYLQKQESYVYTRSYLVFTQKFGRSYERLNAFNKTLLDTLINNREALVKNATVVIPDSGAGLLKSLDLVQTEAEAKNQ